MLLRIPSGRDTPRAVAADIDPKLPGTELWGPWLEGFYSAALERQPNPRPRRGPGQSFLVWWQGDMVRSWLSGNRIGGYDAAKGKNFVVRELQGGLSNNGSKDTPCFSGDILGDWREEVILRTEDPRELRLYVSDVPTKYRFRTFLQDPPYRHGERRLQPAATARFLLRPRPTWPRHLVSGDKAPIAVFRRLRPSWEMRERESGDHDPGSGDRRRGRTSASG